MRKFPRTPENVKRIFIEEVNHVGARSEEDYTVYVLFGYKEDSKEYVRFFWNGFDKLWYSMERVGESLEVSV